MVPLRPAKPKKSSVTCASNAHPLSLTMIRIPASKLNTLRMLTLPVTSRRNVCGSTPTSERPEVLIARVPLALMLNTLASALTETDRRIANPSLTIATPPSARNCRPPMSNAMPNNSWKPLESTRISRKPLPVTKPTKSTDPSMRSRNPGATAVEPRVWVRPVVFELELDRAAEGQADRGAEVEADLDVDTGDEAWLSIRKPESTM